MPISIQQYTADHRYLLEQISQHTDIKDPVALDLDEFYVPLFKRARKKQLIPIDGVLIRDWDPDNRRFSPGLQLGMRSYEVQGIPIVRVRCGYFDALNGWGLDFVAVDRRDYSRLYRFALQCRKELQPPTVSPVLPDDQVEQLWSNTIGYLEGTNLDRIKAYGGRAKRGVLLTGSPGNGKTMACRWIWEACRERRWEYRLVTPDNYRQARAHDSIEDLFSVDRRGIIFFDDMDLALRDRETVHESEDQAVFLSALDGINVHEGVVFLFTTNCALDLIDRAFKRPGRIDLVLQFNPPNEELRHRLLKRWHEDIRAHLNADQVVAQTEGFSFAEIEELKNLLVMRFMDTEQWDWDWATRQFGINRSELGPKKERQVGLGPKRIGLTGGIDEPDGSPF